MTGINYWEQGGKPTSFLAPNFLPADSGNKVTVPIGLEYDVIVEARSLSGVGILRLSSWDAPVTEGIKEFQLTKEFKTYVNAYTETSVGFLYIKDKNGTGDIEVKSIRVVEKGFGRATINGVEGFGTVKPGMTGKLSAVANFVGKVNGSNVEKPHGVYSRTSNTLAPIPFVVGTSVLELSQTNYDRLTEVGGTLVNGSSSPNGFMAQHLFAIDIVWEIEKKIKKPIPGETLSQKINWIKDNTKLFTANYYGHGTSPTGSRATLSVWSPSSQTWNPMSSNTSSAVAKVTGTFNNLNTPILSMTDGFVYFLVNADPSNGTVASSLNSDYFELIIDVKQEAVVDSKWTLHPNATLIDDDTLELNATGDNTNTITVDVEPSTDYILTCGIDIGGFVGGQLLNGQGFAWLTESMRYLTFTTSASQRTLELIVKRTTAGKTIFKRPMITQGRMMIPFEKKSGDRMVPPAPTSRNIINELFQMVPTGDGDWKIGANSYTFYDCKPNTKYTFTAKTKPTPLGGTSAICGAYKFVNAAGVETGALTFMTSSMVGEGQANQVITSPADAVKMGIYFYPESSSYSKYLKDVQLEEGMVATPYTPYKVGTSKLSTKGIHKNMIKPVKGTETSAADYNVDGWNIQAGATFTKISDYEFEFKNPIMYRAVLYNHVVTPDLVGLPVTFSSEMKGPATFVLRFISAGGFQISQVTKSTNGFLELTAVVPANAAKIHCFFEAFSGETISVKNPQLEVGLSASSFRPYAFGSTPINGIPKKNLFDGDLEMGILLGADGQNANSSSSVRPKGFIPVQGGKTYTIAPLRYVFFYDVNKNYISPQRGNGDNSAYTFTTPSNCAYVRFSTNSTSTDIKIQLEEGSAATPYEKYREISRKARKGLEMDGVRDYVQAESVVREPSYPFTIETAFTWAGKHHGGTVGIFGNAAFGLRFDELGGALNKVNFVKYDIADQRITVPFDILPNVRYVLKLIVETTKVSLYINGVWVGEFLNATPYRTDYYNNGKGAFPNSAKFIVGAQGLTTPQHQFQGVFEYVKYFDNVGTILEYDFTNPRSNWGNKIKGKNSADGLITGSPRQLNALALR
jgi:hypothetical protein